MINITAQCSKKIPKKWSCGGLARAPQDHFFGYLWEGMHVNNATLHRNI
jgi:hypothetical protein